ncbi:hypothetical protein, partial [Azospirillum sp. B4]|uniref:hypothetical protein n=1 Tax=Azospirillum sp. B4 TaxID=95605 RepID=UPI0005C8194B
MSHLDSRTGGAIALTAAIALSAAWASPAAAQAIQNAEAPATSRAERKAALQHQLEQVQAALAALDAEEGASPPRPSAAFQPAPSRPR